MEMDKKILPTMLIATAFIAESHPTPFGTDLHGNIR